jgi:hypothetical protein
MYMTPLQIKVSNTHGQVWGGGGGPPAREAVGRGGGCGACY